jgi:sugar phosphate isomerase/epimerase
VALATAAVPAGTLFGAKPNSNINGVQIATITYSYRGEPDNAANKADTLLKMIVDSGISAIELMPPAAELFAGAPVQMGGGGGRGRGPAGGRGPEGARGPGGGGGGRAPMTPEQEAAAAKLRDWRLSASMDKFKEFRKMYNDAGVSIYCHKLSPSPGVSDAEFNYFFEVAAALGARQISLELPNQANEHSKRLGDTALKHNMIVAYHAHEQATEEAWDAVLAQSKGNAVNLDCGHYYAGTGKSPVPAIVKYADRIGSLHLKDRTPTTPQGRGANLPWGQGSTPIREILQTMKKNKYKFPAAIELEYQVPEGSNAVVEVGKCLDFCRKALA